MSANKSELAPGRIDGPLIRMGLVLATGAALATLDATIVNVGIDTLAAHLHSPVSTIQWVATGYLLAVAVGIPLSGWATDRFGGRTVWIVAVLLFVAGSLGSGLAWSVPSLIAFRILQGLGGGMIEPVTQSMMAQAAGPKRVGRVMGVLAIPLMLGPIVGPIVGGAIIDNLDWRWMFLINVPIGLAVVLFALRFVPRQPSDGRQRLDLLGLVLLGAGFALLLYTLGQFSWPTLILAALLLAGYGIHARRSTVPPLIALQLFTHRGFTAVAATLFLVGAAVFGSMFLIPLYYQNIQHQDALAAGLLLALMGLGGIIGMPIAGRLSDRIGARCIVPIGVVLILAGTVPYLWANADANQLWLAVALFTRGLGLSATVAPALASIYRFVPPASAARATAAVYILNQLGGALGIALLSLILHASASTGTPSFGTAFAAMLALTAIALVTSLLLPRDESHE